MTYEKNTVITFHYTCDQDDCSVQFTTNGKYESDAWNEASSKGWFWVAGKGGKHYCPTHGKNRSVLNHLKMLQAQVERDGVLDFSTERTTEHFGQETITLTVSVPRGIAQRPW